MSYSLRLPNGQYVHDIDDAYTRDEALAVLRQKMPQAFASETQESVVPEPKRGGMFGALSKGTESAAESLSTAGQALFGDKKQAARESIKRSDAIDARYENFGDLEKVKAVYEKDGFIAAAKEVIRQFPDVVAENIPNIVAMAAGAKAGAALGSVVPGVGTLIGGLAGGLAGSAGMQFGSNIERQARQQQATGQEIDPNLATAGGAALAQGALDVASFKLLSGKVLGKYFGIAGKDGVAAAEKALLTDAERVALTKTAERGFWATAGRGVATGIGAEVPTEIAQQVLERAQAGLPLFDEDAQREYVQTAYQTTMVGGALGPMGSVADRSDARSQLRADERLKAEAADKAAQEAEAAKRADPAWANSLEGLEERRKELKKEATDLRREIGGIKLDKEAPDLVDQQRKDELSAQHKTLLAQINELNNKVVEAKKSPEQRFIEQVMTPPEEVPLLKRAAAPEVTEPDVAKWEDDTRKQMLADGKKPAEIAAYIAQSRRMRGIYSAQQEQQASGLTFDAQTGEVTDALLLSLTNPAGYKLWTDQAQRERDAGQFPRFGEAGQLAQPVEQMAPVFGADGKIASYRPIDPQERVARPEFELGQKLPAMKQQELGLPTPPAAPAAPPIIPAKEPRATTNLASAAPVAPALSAEQQSWRIAVPGQDVSPRQPEVIPPDAAAPPTLEGQGELPIGGTEEALTRAVLAQRGEIPEGLMPARASGNVARSLTAADARGQAQGAYTELLQTLDALRKEEIGSRWKLDSPQGVEARNPFKAASRPEVATPVKRAALIQKLEELRKQVVRQSLREVMQKRAQMGLRPLTREEAVTKLSQIDALMRELIMRALAKPTPTRGAVQKTKFGKGVLRTAKQAQDVQDAMARIRQRLADIHNELYGTTVTITPERGNDRLAALLQEAGFTDSGTGAQPVLRDRTEVVKAPNRKSVKLLEEEAATLIARDAQLANKLRVYFSGEGKTAKVVKPAPTPEASFQLRRPFGNFKAASAAIFEQIERIKDSMLQTTPGEKQRVAQPFELGKQYLDPKLAPTPETAEEPFTDAALEAEVTGQQKTLFGKELPSRGAGLSLIRMFQGKWRKQHAQLKETLSWVQRALDDLGSENTNVSTLQSRLRMAKSSMDRLTSLLSGDKYGPIERKRIEALADNVAESLRLQKALRAELETSRQQDAVAMNLGLADAVGNEADALPMRRPSTVESQTTKDLVTAEKFASLELKKAEMAFEPYVELNAQIGQLLEAYTDAKRQFSTLQNALEAARGPQRAATQRANANIERAQNALGESTQQANAAVEQATTQAEDTKRRFDLPIVPLREAARPNRLFQPLSAEDKKLRSGKKAGSDPEIARLASEGFREPTRRRNPGEKALRNAEVQKRAFEEQTGQPGYFKQKADEARAKRRSNPDKLLPKAEEFAPDEGFTPDAFNYTNDESDTAFRTGRAETAITPEEAGALAEKAKQLIPNLVYVPTFDQMPLSLAKQIAKDGGDPRAVKGGVLRDGTVFMVGEAHADAADFDATLAHELVGHYKMDRILFGNKTGYQMMQELAAKHIPDELAARNLMVELGFDNAVIEQVLQDGRDAAVAGQDGNLRNLREIVARTSEMKPGSFGPKATGFWKSLVQAFKNLMRGFGINVGKLTADDIHFLVKSAQRGEVRTMQGGDTAFRTKVNTPANLQQASRQFIPETPGFLRSLTKNGWGMIFRTQFVDRFEPFVRVAREMLDNVKASQLMYYLRMTDRVNQLTAESLTNGAIALEKTKDGKGYLYQSHTGANIRDIVNMLKGEDFRTWYTYIALERAQVVGTEKLLGEELQKIAPAQQAEILSYGRSNQAFQDARKMYREYNAKLIKLLLDTGDITEKAAADWASRDYIPYFRKDELGDIWMMGDHPIKIGNIRDQKDIAHLVGSDKALDDPYENIARNTRILVGTAVRNMAAKNTAHEFHKLGLGTFAKGKALNIGRNVIHFKEHGEDRSFLVNTSDSKNEALRDIPGDILAKSLEGIATQVPTILKLLQVPTKFLRDAITLNPLYMVRQLTRDPMHAWLSTGMDTKALLNAYGRVGKLMVGKDKTGELLRERGLVGGQLIQGTDEDMSRIMSQLHAGQNVWSKAVSWLHDKGVAADATTRAALYDNFIKKGLSELEATMATMDSVNFATRGLSSSVQMANMLVPFFNAQIQGLDSVWRSLTGQMPFNERLEARQKLVQRAMMLAATTVAYYALVEDEDWYKNTPENVRLMNTLIKLPGVDEPIRIPRPFEFGMMFMAVPEAIMMGSKGDPEAKAAWAALRNQMENQVPGGSSFFLPAAMKPMVEVAANHSFFTGKSIVPSGMEDAPAEDQWTPNTTESAKTITGMLGNVVSPMHVEHLIKGYTAAIGYSTLQLLDSALTSTSVPKPDKPMSRWAVVGPAFQQTDGSAIITRAYEQANKFASAQKRFNAAKEQGRIEDALEVVDKQPGELAKAKSAGQFTQKMGELTKKEKQVHFAPADVLSAEEKTVLLKQLRQAKIELATQYENAWR